MRWQDRKPRYRVVVAPQIRESRRKAVIEFVRWFEKEVHPAKHYVVVGVLNVRRIRHETETRLCLGFFFKPDNWKRDKLGPAIMVAGRLQSTWRVIWVLCHELAHYERECRGGAFNERGIDRRANALLKRYYESMGYEVEMTAA